MRISVIHDLIVNEGIDLACIAETWMDSEDDEPLLI